MSRLCTICARGGSKGIPNKNLRPLLGRSLLAHTLGQARSAGLFDLIGVSSDSADILGEAERCGADIVVRRPADLASDQAAKLPAIRHCAVEIERRTGTVFDTFVDLDATSPLRLPQDIVAAVQMLERSDADNLITAMPARRSPYFNMVETDGPGRVHLVKTLPSAVVRRQDAPACYDLNASIYVWRRAALLQGEGAVIGDNTILYAMPEERSIDIDSELDFAIVEFLLRKRMADA